MLESLTQVYGLRRPNVLWGPQLAAQVRDPAHDAGRHALGGGAENVLQHHFRAFQVAQERLAMMERQRNAADAERDGSIADPWRFQPWIATTSW
ncbi:hypothetical protein [Streptomyces sp. NPDC048242]|uniref:hypothetical protein n=1 Tax=Streptomyces sp. NPDC048242 TaxID=3155026 RepID=UPI0034141212